MKQIKILLFIFFLTSCSTGIHTYKVHRNQRKSQIHAGSGNTGMDLRKNKLKTCSKTKY